MTLTVLAIVGAHYYRLAPLASEDRLELRGQYFPLNATIRVSGNPAEADYYAPSLMVRMDDQHIRENPLIVLSGYDKSQSTLQAALTGLARPLRLNGETRNMRLLRGQDTITIHGLQLAFSAGWLSRSKFIIGGREYQISWPQSGSAVSLSEALCRAGFSLAEQQKAFPPPAAGQTQNATQAVAPVAENPLEQLWLVRDGWWSLGMVNGSSRDVQINGEPLLAEATVSLKDGDQLTYGSGRRPFSVRIRIIPSDNRICLIPPKPQSYPLYLDPERESNPVTQVFISSSSGITSKANYQFALGERNRDLVKGSIQYVANPDLLGKVGKPDQSPEDKAQEARIYAEGFAVNNGLSLKAYKAGETAALGSGRGGVLLSLNRKQATQWRPLINVALIWAGSAVFFLLYGWIARRNYLFVLMPTVQFILAIRLILSYRGYVIPPNMDESYEKALFAATFLPFAVFLWLYFKEMCNAFDYSGRWLAHEVKLFGPAWRSAVVQVLGLPPVWYLLSCCLLVWLFAPLSNYAGIMFLLAFAAITIVVARLITAWVPRGAADDPLIAWLENGVEPYDPSGAGGRWTSWLRSGRAWDIVLLYSVPLVGATALWLTGFKRESIPYLELRAELVYLPFLILGSCRLYMWFFQKYFDGSYGNFRLRHLLWLAVPVAVYFIQTAVVGDWGFFVYSLSVGLLALVISWRASRFVSYAIIASFLLLGGLFLKSPFFTVNVAAMLPDNSTIQYRYLAYEGSGYLQRAVLETNTEDEAADKCQSSSRTAQRIFGINEHFWTMFHFASQGWAGVGYGRAPLERVPFADGIAQSDNVYSIYLMAEGGARAGVSVLALYLFLALLILYILTQHFADRPAPTLLAGGIALAFAISAFYHALGNIGGVPFTGKNLPLLSLNSLSDALLYSVLFALAFSVIGNGLEDLRSDASGILDAFGSDNKLNRWVLFIALFCVGLAAWGGWQTVRVAQDTAYRGDYDLDQFVHATKKYINDGLIAIDESGLRIRPLTENAKGLAEGQYLRSLIEQFNGAGREDKESGRFFFVLRNLYLDEDIYGAERASDRSRETVLTVDQNYFKRASPFGDRVFWRGGVQGRDASDEVRDAFSGEGLGLFFEHQLNSDNPIPGASAERRVRLSAAAEAGAAPQSHTGRRFRVENDSGEHLFDLYAIEDDTVLEPVAANMFVNGQGVRDKVRLEAGDIIAVGRSPRTRDLDLVFSYQRGAAGQFAHYHWLNGREAFSYPQGESFALARPVVEAINTQVSSLTRESGEAAGREAAGTSLTLSLSTELNREIYGALAREGAAVWEEINGRRGLPPRLAVTALDPETGEVLALASWPSFNPNPRPAEQEKRDPLSYSSLLRRRDPESRRYLLNHNLTRHVLGSATKPFIASASASAFNELLTLEVDDNSAAYNRVFGIPTTPEWQGNDHGHVAWEQFLPLSNNLYAVSIGFLGLAQPGPDGRLLWSGRTLQQSFVLGGTRRNSQPDFGDRFNLTSGEALNLDKSPLAQRLRDLFDVQIEGPDAEPATGVWRGAQQLKLLPEKGAALSFISPETPNLALNHVRGAREFTMVCLGGKTNLWSNVKSAEAFSRLVTGRRVSAHLTRLAPDERAAFEDLGWGYGPVRAPLLRALEQVPLTGTASALATRIRAIGAASGTPGQRFAVFAKTGTLEGQLGRNDSNFIFAAGLWDETAQTLRRGVVVTVYIEKGDRAGGAGRAALFSRQLLEILDGHLRWSRAAAAQPAAAPRARSDGEP